MTEVRKRRESDGKLLESAESDHVSSCLVYYFSRDACRVKIVLTASVDLSFKEYFPENLSGNIIYYEAVNDTMISNKQNRHLIERSGPR